MRRLLITTLAAAGVILAGCSPAERADTAQDIKDAGAKAAAEAKAAANSPEIKAAGADLKDAAADAGAVAKDAAGEAKEALSKAGAELKTGAKNVSETVKGDDHADPAAH
ncbi:MAG: cell surface protein [Phenylobacterium sp.]|uniref:cell surface protein n=1 Tax=Phenylobacterium sp. TaxID=1871053 RepID=UPI00273529D0|nr:cell surface protein [Phenylobacterium sp.]MDP3172926.1 cell surface protein [Phenylobacterium sp.]